MLKSERNPTRAGTQLIHISLFPFYGDSCWSINVPIPALSLRVFDSPTSKMAFCATFPSAATQQPCAFWKENFLMGFPSCFAHIQNWTMAARCIRIQIKVIHTNFQVSQEILFSSFSSLHFHKPKGVLSLVQKLQAMSQRKKNLQQFCPTTFSSNRNWSKTLNEPFTGLLNPRFFSRVSSHY